MKGNFKPAISTNGRFRRNPVTLMRHGEGPLTTVELRWLFAKSVDRQKNRGCGHAEHSAVGGIQLEDQEDCTRPCPHQLRLFRRVGPLTPPAGRRRRLTELNS